MKEDVLRLVLLGLCLHLVACQVENNGREEEAPTMATATSSSISAFTAPAAITPDASPAVSTKESPASQALGTAPSMATPHFPATQVARSLVLSTGTSTSCQLPCWHDLRVGMSTQSDVEHVFTQLFGTDVDYDYFAPPTEPGLLLTKLLDIEGTYAGGHNWYLEDAQTGVAGTYYLYAFFEEATGLLVGIEEIMKPFGVYEVPSLPEIVDRVGEPDWIYAGSAASIFQVVLYYRQGIRIDVGINKNQRDASTDVVCFDEVPLTEGYSLVDPYGDPTEGSPSMIQEKWGTPRDPAPYIDEILGMRMNEFVAFINLDYPCMEIPR